MANRGSFGIEEKRLPTLVRFGSYAQSTKNAGF